jgi:transposase
MAKKSGKEHAKLEEDFLMDEPPSPFPNIKDPRIAEALSMFVYGQKKSEIAEYFGVHRKTVGRWLKKVKDGVKIDVEGEDYNTVFMEALAEHGELLLMQRQFALQAFIQKDYKAAYAYQRRCEGSLRKRDKALETFGIRYKSRIEEENETLKKICAWALIRMERMEDNLLALEDGEEKLWDDPFNVSEKDINKLKECPEMFHFDRYFTGAKKDNNPKYMDRYDLEMAAMMLSLFDPEFDPATDDPATFASRKIFSDSLPLEDIEQGHS